jgi:glycosyltransferase involved in cell wall biosynthesis
LIEAMSCELPVVGTRCDGIPEVIEADVTGYLVAPQAPKELADKVELLLSDPSLRKRMGKAGRHRVKVLFSRDEHVKRMIEVYKNLTCVGGLA